MLCIRISKKLGIIWVNVLPIELRKASVPMVQTNRVFDQSRNSDLRMAYCKCGGRTTAGLCGHYETMDPVIAEIMIFSTKLRGQG